MNAKGNNSATLVQAFLAAANQKLLVTSTPLWVTRALSDIALLLPPHLFLKLGTGKHLASPPSTSPL